MGNKSRYDRRRLPDSSEESNGLELLRKDSGRAQNVCQ
jgi:hypothetical protein